MEKVSFKYIGNCGGIKALLGEHSAYFEHGRIYEGAYAAYRGIQFDGIDGIYDSELFKEVNMENSVKDVVQGDKCDKLKEELLRKINGGKVDNGEAESEKVLIKDPIKYHEGGKTDGDNLEVGGTHYQTAIQPWDYIAANGLGFDEGNVVKYITRHKDKNGAEDIEKVISYCKHILKTQYKR